MSTIEFQAALRRHRLRNGECPECGTPLESGYGLAAGGIGYYEFCRNRRCKETFFNVWPDPEMDEHTSEGPTDNDVQTSNDDV